MLSSSLIAEVGTMQLLKRLFGGGGGVAKRGEDQVWISDAARLKRIRAEVERLRGQGHSALVVAWTRGELDRIASALASFEPARCADAFGRDSVGASIAQAGAVTVALATALPAQVRAVAIPVEIVVCGRGDTRKGDDAVVHFADLLGPRASVTFHVSMEDAVLRDHVAALTPILTALGITEDEPISSPMVSRAIQNAQLKRERGFG